MRNHSNSETIQSLIGNIRDAFPNRDGHHAVAGIHYYRGDIGRPTILMMDDEAGGYLLMSDRVIRLDDPLIADDNSPSLEFDSVKALRDRVVNHVAEHNLRQEGPINDHMRNVIETNDIYFRPGLVAVIGGRHIQVTSVSQSFRVQTRDYPSR